MWYHEPMIHIIQFHIIQFTVTKDDDLTHTSGLFGLIPSFLRTKDRSGDKSPQRFDHPHPQLEVALDTEQLLYEATTLLNAASLINRIARQS